MLLVMNFTRKCKEAIWTTSFKTRTNLKKKHRGKRTGVYFVDGFHLLCQACVLQMC